MSVFLEVTTKIGCPVNCDYCPQSLFLSQYKSEIMNLSLDNFKLAIDKLPENSTISFAGFSEPMMNSDAVDMIEYVYSKNHKIMLLTTLVGMTIQQYDRIRHLNWDHFSIHLPDNKGKTKINITQDYINLLTYVVSNPPNGMFLCNHHLGDVHDSIKHIISSSNLLTIHDRAGAVKTSDAIVKDLDIKGNIKCGHRFLFNYPNGSGVLLPNMDVILCCSDFGLQYRLGNLMNSSWNEIMNSETMQYVISSLTDESKDSLCRKCFLATAIL